MNSDDSYEVKPFDRQIIVEFMEQGIRKHNIAGLFEVDVTAGRQFIRDYEARTKKELSFTAWITKCIAQAVTEHKHVHAIVSGKKLIIFNDVDISVMVERLMEGEEGAHTYIVRNANEKTVNQIQDEIWSVRSRGDDEISDTVDRKMMKRLFVLPKFLRDYLFWRKFRNNPHFIKKHLGTVSVTAVGMYGKGTSGWAVPITIAPLTFALGGMAKKPAVIEDKIEIREFLSITVFLNHDVVDGGPATRFVARFAELVENAYGLPIS